MDRGSSPQGRVERLIAFGRLVLALASFAAVYLDPFEPSRYPELTYSLLGIYAFYATAAAIWSVAAPDASRHRQVAMHVVDLVFFGAINGLTAGASSPLFIYFVFSMICAMLRFGRRGTIATAAFAFVTFVGSGLLIGERHELELNRFIIRSTYILVAGSLLVYFAEVQQRTQADLARIAEWPRLTSKDRKELISALLREMLAIFRPAGIVIAYEHPAGSAAFVAADDGAFTCYDEPQEIADAILEPDPDASLEDIAAGIPVRLLKRYGVEAAVITEFSGELVRGRLVLLQEKRGGVARGELLRAAVNVIAARLDHEHASDHLRRGAVAEERVRVARDLHDSVLQSLTGAALQLRTIPRLIEKNRDEALDRLREIENVIVTGQKELRGFIEQLHPDRRRGDAVVLSTRLHALAERFRQQWSIEVKASVEPMIEFLPVAVRHEIYGIVAEAIANAAKHAHAKHVHARVAMHAARVQIRVADDGKGFPFRGLLDLETMIRTARGPVTLKERVSLLRGNMTIDSAETGSTIDVQIPAAAGG